MIRCIVSCYVPVGIYGYNAPGSHNEKIKNIFFPGLCIITLNILMLLSHFHVK